MIEQLMQEWKVGDFAVAESIFKSRQRQLKQKGGAQMRQKMQVGKPRVCEKERKGKTTRFGISLCDDSLYTRLPRPRMCDMNYSTPAAMADLILVI